MNKIFTIVFTFYLGCCVCVTVQDELNVKVEEFNELTAEKSNINVKTLKFAENNKYPPKRNEKTKFPVNYNHVENESNEDEANKIFKRTKIKFASNLKKHKSLEDCNKSKSINRDNNFKEKPIPGIKHIQKRSSNASYPLDSVNSTGINDLEILNWIEDSQNDFSNSTQMFDRLTLKKGALFTDILDSIYNVDQQNISCIYPQISFENLTSYSVFLATNFTSNFCVKFRPEYPDLGIQVREYWCWNTTYVCLNTSQEIEGLCPFINYAVSVAMRCTFGFSVKELPSIFTPSSIPDKPENVTVTTTSRTAHVRWTAPSFFKGEIIKYTILCESAGFPIKEVSHSEEYIISALQPYTTYSFRVNAYTTAGPGEWSNNVTADTKIGIPHEPTDLKMPPLKMTNTSVYLEWKEPIKNTGPIIRYTIQVNNRYCNKDYPNCSENYFKTINTTTTFHNITGLIPYSNYSVLVAAVTKAGTGYWSKAFHFRTLPGVPGEPRRLTVTTTNTTATLNWQAPHSRRGPQIFYAVDYSISESKISTTLITNKTTLIIDNLDPYTMYIFRVAAKNSAGQGNWTEPTEKQTKVGVPKKPIIHVVFPYNDSATVLWGVQEKTTGPIDNYTLLCQDRSITGDTIFYVVNSTFLTIGDLKPYTYYLFQVAARSSAGMSEWSDPWINRTEIGVPFSPENVTISSVTNTSLTLSWSEPSPSTGPITLYNISDRHNNFSVRDTYKTFTDLEPYTQYYFKVKAFTQVGDGNWSEEIGAKTGIGVPHKVKKISLDGNKRKPDIVVRWGPPEPSTGPTNFTVLLYTVKDTCWSKSKDNIANYTDFMTFSDQFMIEMIGLIPWTTYKVYVMAETIAGKSISESSDSLTTPITAPGMPFDLSASCSYSPTELTLTWQPPKIPNGEVEKYFISLIGEKEGHRTISIDVTRNTTYSECNNIQHVIKDLKPEFSYRFNVSLQIKHFYARSKPAKFDGDCTLPAGKPPIPTVNLTAVKTSRRTISFKFERQTFSGEMGEIRHYSVIVVKNNINDISEENTTEFPKWIDSKRNDSVNIYQATPERWNPFKNRIGDPFNCEEKKSQRNSLICTLGWERNCSERVDEYCNGPLEAGMLYGIKIRGFTNGGFSDTSLLTFETDQDTKEGPNIGGMVAGIILSLCFIFVITGAILYFKKTKKPKVKNEILRIFSLSPPVAVADENNEIPITNTWHSSHEIKLAAFIDHVMRMAQDTNLKFSEEFEEIRKRSPGHPAANARIEENKSKNRWANILPFDHSRVKILPIDDEPGSDYINASYIPGFSCVREYIATQGPIPSTIDDFWRMIWEQNVTMIVMLTPCVERGKTKCEKYWPDSDGQHYGDLRISLQSESMLTSYIIRIFQVQLANRQREVRQMHFTRWKDFGCPEDTGSLINFVSAVRDHLPHKEPGPIVVHCSAGVGRTGTYIALDRLMKHIKTNDHVDVFNTVLDMREHRQNMVQTEDQYIYIHFCLRDLILERKLFEQETDTEEIYSNIKKIKDTPI